MAANRINTDGAEPGGGEPDADQRLRQENAALLAELAELQRREAALRRVSALQQHMLQSVPGGVIHIRRDGTFLWANVAATRTLNLEPEQVAKLRIEDFAGKTLLEDGSACPPELYPASRCLATGQPQGPLLIGTRVTDGSVSWAVYSAVPVPASLGEAVEGVLVTFFDVTPRKRAEESQVESQRQFRLALRAAMMGTWDIDLATWVVRGSDTVDLLFGFDRSLPQRPLEEYLQRIHPEDRQRVRQTIELALQTRREHEVEYRVLLDDRGTVRWIASRGEVMADETGRALRLIGASIDITDRKNAENAVRDSEERYRYLFERNPQPMWVYDIETLRFLAVNDAAVRHYGYAVSEFLAMRITDIRPPGQIPILLEHIGRGDVVRFGQDFPWRHRLSDGRLIDVEITSHAMRFAGRPAKLVLASDVTARRRVEEALRRAHDELESRVQQRTTELSAALEALRESEGLFRQIAENIGEVFWLTDIAAGRVIYVSPAYEVVFGMSCQSLYDDPMSFLKVVAAEDVEHVRRNLAQQVAGEGDLVYRVRQPGRPQRWVRSRSFPIRNRAGEVYRMAGIGEDITDLKRVEEELSRLAWIAESSDDAIIGTSLDGTVLSWNNGAQQIYGYTAAEIVGKNQRLVALPELQDEYLRLVQRVMRGEAVRSYETRRVRKDGTLFDLSLTLSAVRDGAGNVIGISAIGRDVTQKNRLEREVLKVTERERRRLGQDLHDGLGQHLTGIAFLSKVLEQSLASRGLSEARDAAQVAELVQQAIGQARALAKGLSPVQATANGLMTALQDLCAQAESLFRIPCTFRCDAPVAVGDNVTATHLYRIAQEAISNAAKHGKPQSVQLELSLARPDLLELRVFDDGSGIPEKPDTSKGMGLRTMEYRARMIGASLVVEGGARGGTLVRCALPVSGGARQGEAHADGTR